MPKLKILSASEVIGILQKFEFHIHSQKGSNIKIHRVGTTGNETLTVPNHKELETETCKAVFRQATKYINEAELYDYFYSA